MLIVGEVKFPSPCAFSVSSLVVSLHSGSFFFIKTSGHFFPSHGEMKIGNEQREVTDFGLSALKGEDSANSNDKAAC